MYNSEYFIEKNRNEVVPEFQNCLSSSSLSFIQNLSSYLDPDDIHSVTSKAGILTRGMPSPTKSQRILGSASPAGVGKSPSRTSSRSMLFTPNKPKVSFLEPTQSSSTHPSTPPITPSTIQRSMTTTGTTSSNTTPSSSSNLLQRTSTTLGSATRGPQRTGTSPKIQSVKKKSTLFTSFTKQLHNLIDSIKTTRSHFIRCIKPNSIMSSNEYNYQLVMSQLRCGGVLGAIQVFRAGFPNRFYFLNFIERYLIFTTIIGNNNLIIQNFNYLKRKSLENPSNLFYWKVTCQIFLQCIPLVQIILDLLQIPEKGDHHHTSTSNTTTSTSNGKNFLKKFKITTKTLFEICSKHSFHLQQQDQQITIGKKQIFLRAIYYEYLENLLYRSNSLYAHIVQHNWKYRHLTSSINSTTSEKPKEEIIILHFHHMFTLQPSRYKIKLFFQFLISFQRRYRVYYHSRRFRLARYLSTWISSHYRGGKARIHIRNIKINMIKKIQKLWRSYYQYKIYHKKLQSIRSIQGWYRTRRYEMIRRREGQRFQDGIQYSLIKLQARYRGSKVRILYNKLLLEKVSGDSRL